MKKIVFILLFSSSLCFSQLHLNVGVVEIHNRKDGYTITSEIGYTYFKNKIGVGLNYRNTSVRGDIYDTFEIHSKYRFVNNKKYRFDIGFGGGFNIDEKDVHPIVTTRNSIRILDNLWLNINLDNFYRNSKDIIKPGWRVETYFTAGVSMNFIKPYTKFYKTQ